MLEARGKRANGLLAGTHNTNNGDYTMDITKRISDLSRDDLERLLKALNFSLSGDTVGEAGTFALLAEIESIAIKERKSRDTEKGDRF